MLYALTCLSCLMCLPYKETVFYMRSSLDDATLVWFDWLQPHLVRLLVECTRCVLSSMLCTLLQVQKAPIIQSWPLSAEDLRRVVEQDDLSPSASDVHMLVENRPQYIVPEV